MSKEIETQEIEVMVKMTFSVSATIDKEEATQQIGFWVYETMELMEDMNRKYEFMQSEIVSLKEEAEIYGNEKPTKAILKAGETEGCTAESKNGVYNLTVKHGEKYDFMYDDEGNFYLIVDDRLFPETSTAFDFE